MKKFRRKKRSNFDILSSVSGLSKGEIKGIAIKVKENQNKLDSCSCHSFVPIDDPSMSRYFICENCGGTISSMNKNWYEKGLEHGKWKVYDDFRWREGK